MPRIRVILEQDNGEPFASAAEQVYPLSGPCDNLNQIEAAVEQLKRSLLPVLERSLLQNAQERQADRQKKTSVGGATD
jgi:hypothetical protein